MSIRAHSERLARLLTVTTAAASLVFSLREARADTSEPAPAEPPTAPKLFDDPELEASRARFRKGMDAYLAGDFASAIVTWQAIYAELGKERGYRLAFNLGRAHDAFGDATRAAELYATYLDEVTRRTRAGETLPALVEKQAKDSEERLAELVRTRGRLRVPAGKAPVEVRIDGGTPRLAGFSSLLAPGKHVLVFGTGGSEVRREIAVVLGEELVVEPPPPRDLAPALPPKGVFETRTTRPFSPVWIFVGAGATALSVLIPALQYSSALSIASQHDASTDPLERERLASEYSGVKTSAYATLSIPIALGVATLGLGAAFALGSRSESVRIGVRGLGLGATLTY